MYVCRRFVLIIIGHNFKWPKWCYSVFCLDEEKPSGDRSLVQGSSNNNHSGCSVRSVEHGHILKEEVFCQLRAGICQQAVSFRAAGEGSSLDQAFFAPTPPPSCPGRVGSKSIPAATHTHTHTSGLHKNVSAPAVALSGSMCV